MLLGVHPPSSPVKHWWGSRFSRRRPDPCTGSTDLHGLSVAGLGPDLTYQCYNKKKNNKNNDFMFVVG